MKTFGRGLNIAEPILEIGRGLKRVLIVDEAIKELYGVSLAQKIDASLLTIPTGEQAKSLTTAARLIDQLAQMGCGRDTLLIALGGGVTTDLVGFAASIYMRGVPLVLIPTTLLAIVDAAIGGKTGIDTHYGKNLIGTIYEPKAVFADLDFIETLSEKERLNGMAEILKMGLIYDSSICTLQGDVIFKAIQGKIAIVEEDLKEQHVRRILNFGHTIGHALETLSSYEMSHGEAVALGSLAEAHLSMQLGYLSEDDFESILPLYRPFPLKLPKGYSRQKLLSAMAHDKKRAKGEVRFVLIDKIGHAIPFEGAYCRPVSEEELAPTLKWMEEWQ